MQGIFVDVRGRAVTATLLAAILASPSLAAGAEGHCATEVAASFGQGLLQAKSLKSKTASVSEQGPREGRLKDEQVAHSMLQSYPDARRSAPESGSPAELLGGRADAGQAAGARLFRLQRLPYICLVCTLLVVAAYAAFRQQLLTQLLRRLNLTSEPEKGMLEDQVNLCAEDSSFCQELLVPAGCECILLVPTRPKRDQPYDITDTQGSNVLSVVGDESHGKGSAGVQRRMLVAGGDMVLAQCGRARSSLPASMLTSIDFELLSSAGEVWAKLTYEPREGAEDRCTIKTKNGKYFLQGSVRHNAMNMSDANGILIATTEPTTEPGPLGQPAGSFFKLRAAPLSDVGLILCSLICLQHLST